LLLSSATGAAQRRNFLRESFPRKYIQKLSAHPVLLVLPSAKNSTRRVFHGQEKIQKLSFQPVALVLPSAKNSSGQVFHGKNSKAFLLTSATGAAQRQNFLRASFPWKKFRSFPSNQCHWCCLSQNFLMLKFLQKKIQKLSFQPVPLVLPSAKTFATFLPCVNSNNPPEILTLLFQRSTFVCDLIII
jgi:hypothetical protein